METKFKRRLTKLADLLDADASNKDGVRFNLELLAVVDDEEDPLSCGTQACALGLAALSGKFERVGMRVDVSSRICGNTISIGYDDGDGIRWDWLAAAKWVFGLTLGEVQWLFTASSYNDKGTRGAAAERMVAARVRQMAAGTARLPEPYSARAW